MARSKLESTLALHLEMIISLSRMSGESDRELAEQIVDMFGEALDNVKAEMDAKDG